MAYTALAEMQRKNKEFFCRDVGPIQPRLFDEKKRGQDGEKTDSLKSAALRFLHERCEKLCFDEAVTEKEEQEGKYQGTSISRGQIPYNMEMDINRLCLERELERFIDSGVAEDAYNVYYCFMKIFMGGYGQSKKTVEFLSEYESNGGSLLMKHRDHYVHSVYVFVLGLAIFETNKKFREEWSRYYGYKEDQSSDAANCFLEYWGLSSLFHDIGYPFEIPFEQIISYFEAEKKRRGKETPFLVYQNIELLTELDSDESDHLYYLYGKRFDSTDDLFAYVIAEKMGKHYRISEDKLRQVIREKPFSPQNYSYYMDHAYFSSILLYRELVESIGISGIRREHIDALSAILLHNSLFKFSIAKNLRGKADASFKMEDHPLAYLLLLCDSLQCWDRTAYGRSSRTKIYPIAADFKFTQNSIQCTYSFDLEEKDKILDFQKEYSLWEKNGRAGEEPKLKCFSDMAGEGQIFLSEIEETVDTTYIALSINTDMKNVNRRNKHTYLSTSNFLHLFDFAVALNARYSHEGREKNISSEILEREFEDISLEYQISNINQAKNFSVYLNEIHCFYTDRPVDFNMIRSFTKEDTDIIAPLEHERWVREHITMGWQSGDIYENIPIPDSLITKRTGHPVQELSEKEEKLIRRDLREQFRMHKLAMAGNPSKNQIFEHYQSLTADEQGKDYEPFNRLLKLIKKYDGLRIYREKV